MEESVLPAVRRELEAVVHDLRAREVPEIDVVAEIPGDVEIEEAVAIVVEPDCAVAVHPPAQPGLLGYILEMFAVNVSEQREITVAIDEQVLAAIVVEVAPHPAHRHSFAGSIQIGDPRRCGNVLEGSVAAIAVQRIGLAEPAIGEVEIRPAVAIEVGYGNRCADCRDVGLDTGDFRVEGRTMVDEVDAGRSGRVAEDEARVGRIGARAHGAAVEPHRQQNGGKKRDGDDRAAGTRTGSAGHSQSIASGWANSRNNCDGTSRVVTATERVPAVSGRVASC